MRIRWTSVANRTLERLLTNQKKIYSRNDLRQLNRDLKETEKLLPDNPLMGAVEPLAEGLTQEYRHVVLCSPFKLVYFVYEDCIFIADIWDTRQSTEHLVVRLK